MSDAPATALVTLEPRGNAVVVHVNGMLNDEADMKALTTGVEQASAMPGVTLVVLDLAGVKLVPSLGLGAIVQMSNKCKAKKQKLKLAGMTPPVRQLFTITRLDRVLELAGSVDSAIE